MILWGSLGTLECKTISETAAYFHLTEKYVSVIEADALKTLKNVMNDYKIVLNKIVATCRNNLEEAKCQNYSI